MSDIGQVMTRIKEEFQQLRPNNYTILNILSDLRSKGEYQHLSDSEFFDIVGKTLEINPEFFMNKVYSAFRKKMTRLLRDQKVNKMDKELMERFCFLEGEQILFECKGKLAQNKKMTPPIYITSASFFFTNFRIIAQGKLKGPYYKYIQEEIPSYGYILPTKNLFRLKKGRSDIKYRVNVENSYSEILIKLPLGESQAHRDEKLNKIYEILSKEEVKEV
ncbi:MAG: hypothetical protein ACW98D_12580 [Promethearchaeota archaeon]|jgi:hypothetical protein